MPEIKDHDSNICPCCFGAGRIFKDLGAHTCTRCDGLGVVFYPKEKADEDRSKDTDVSSFD